MPSFRTVAVVAATLAAVPAAALEVTSDRDAFLAAHPPTATIAFPFPGNPADPYADNLPIASPYQRSVATFTASQLVLYGDAGDYLGGYGGLTTTARGAKAIGFVYSAFYGSDDLQVSVDGQTFDLGPSFGDDGFIGFSDTRPIGPVTFTGGGSGENDLYLVYLSTVPEPGAWTLLVAGFGLVGAALRRRPAAARA